MDLSTTVINYAAYEGETEYLGIAQVTLPKLSFMTQGVKGSGIMGEIDVANIAELESMQIQIQMLVTTAQSVQMMEHRIHDWEFREVQQSIDGATGTHKVTGVKHVFKAFPVSMDGGTLKPQSTSDPTITAAVYYWAMYRDGVKVLELDPLNYICFINGTDYAANVRNAMGK